MNSKRKLSLLSSSYNSESRDEIVSNNGSQNLALLPGFLFDEKENGLDIYTETQEKALFAKSSVIIDVQELCLVCDENLQNMSEEDQEKHLSLCLDAKGVVASQLENTSTTKIISNNERGLRDPEFFCVLCDVNLSRRQLVSRCLHLKKCAKDKLITTKQLLQLIAPIDDGIAILDCNSSNSAEIEVIDLCGDESDLSHPVQSFAAKNALSVLMSSAKEHASKGMWSGVSKHNKVHSSSHKAVKTSSEKSNSILVNSSAGVAKPTNNSFKGKRHINMTVNKNEGTNGYAPAYKRIQLGSMSFPIVVDGFQYASSALSDCYFLTHFHSDHYMGITKDFSCGSIYCSPTTANLVKLKFKVASKYIIPLELERKYTIAAGGVDVEVTLTDANHCPGAVCILFRFPTYNKAILHTGDFRWDNNLLPRSVVFRSLSASNQQQSDWNLKNLTVYLDTTYCDEAYSFPRQEMAISAVVETIRKEKAQPGALYVFGAYSIGKERVFMAAAQELGVKVFVDKGRWQSMLCYDWPVEDQARLTTDSTATNLWVVQLNQINFNGLQNIKKKRPQSNRVIAFQPTGWTHSGSGKGDSSNSSSSNGLTNIIHERRKDKDVIYSVAYSEHSSFTELTEFVQGFKPCKIIPTVNVSPDKVQKQLDLLKRSSKVYDTTSLQVNPPALPSDIGLCFKDQFSIEEGQSDFVSEFF